MTSLLDVRLGVSQPEILHLPPDVHSLAGAEEAIELADSYLICDGNPLAESQKITLRAGMGERADGSWAAARVGDFGPRQGTGKNDKIAARELAGLLLFGEQLLIHTAHEFPTANEAFLRMVAVFESWEDLRKRVAHIYTANGAQSIVLRTGQRLLYKARTGGSMRGFAKADLIVYDEAQHVGREHIAASGPAKLANPNSQSWYAGSGGLATSEVAWEMRRAAILGNAGRLAYTEKTGQHIEVIEGRIVTTDPDPSDRDIWYQAIPGLGRWVTEEGVEALMDELGELGPREGLCVWEPDPTANAERWLVIPRQPWVECERVGHEPSGSRRYALEVDTNAKGETWASIGMSDGIHVEDVSPPDRPAGTGWVVDACKARKDEIGELLVAQDGPAASLIDDLEAAGVPVRKVKPAEFVQASMQLVEACIEGSLRHIDQAALNRSVAGVVKRDVGDGQSRFSRKMSPVDIGPLNAIAIARWGAREAPPVPSGLVDPNDYEEDEP